VELHDRGHGVKQSVPITLTHMVTALITAGLTVAAIRNLPGVLELLFLTACRWSQAHTLPLTVFCDTRSPG